jgi:hypothetical protein
MFVVKGSSTSEATRRIREYEKHGQSSHAAELADKEAEKTKREDLKTRALEDYKKGPATVLTSTTRDLGAIGRAAADPMVCFATACNDDLDDLQRRLHALMAVDRAARGTRRA